MKLKPNLLDLIKLESGRTVSTLAKTFGPLPPDDGDGQPPVPVNP